MAFTYTPKQLEHIALALQPSTERMYLEGTSRSSKSFTLASIAYQAISRSPDYLHCLSAYDGDAINDIFLDSDYGLLNAYKGCTVQKDKIGGYYLTIPNKNPNFDGAYKKVLLVPHGNASKWKKVLGKGIGVCIVTEVNTADPDFLAELPSRQEAAKQPLIVGDLNGDIPDHDVYQNAINYCRMLGVVPKETKDLMTEFQDKKGTKRGWYYSHWTRRDNPAFSLEQIDRSLAQYVPGSFRYYSKGLGLRVAPEGSIFADVLMPLKEKSRLFDLHRLHEVKSASLGLDYDKDIKILTITAQLHNRKLVVLDYKRIKGNLDIDDLDFEFKAFFKKWQRYLGRGKIRNVYYDHNEFVATQSLRKRNRSLRWEPAAKQDKFGLESRAANYLILFKNEKVVFTELSVSLIDELSKLVYDNTGRKWCKVNKTSKKATHFIDSMFYSKCKYWLRMVI